MKPVVLSRACLLVAGTPFVFCWLMAASWGQELPRPVAVRFHEPRTEVVEASTSSGPIDPTVRVQIQNTGGMAFGLTADGIRLTFSSGSIRTTFMIDNQIVNPNTPVPTPLPSTQSKPRHGFTSAFRHNDLIITQIIEAVPTRPLKTGDKRRLDAVLVRYLVENKGNRAHTIATRVRIDTHCNNDGALFAAPTFPKQILDGIEMKDKTLPAYVQILQNPDLHNPINMGHFGLKFGSRMSGPDRFVCTSHGAFAQGWEIPVQRAGGDSDCVMYWNPRTVQPGSKLELAYSYGKGLAIAPQSEGRLSIAFGGSFEPNKLFSLLVSVHDPASNQTLALDLPPGMELVEGKQLQPVPAPGMDATTSLVLWKCRVKELGEHTIRIRSSNGITQTRTITISRPEGKATQ